MLDAWHLRLQDKRPPDAYPNADEHHGKWEDKLGKFAHEILKHQACSLFHRKRASVMEALLDFVDGIVEAYRAPRSLAMKPGWSLSIGWTLPYFMCRSDASV
tara:strand:- start:196 stop:501 length:306 start_codon:yes stop_codon:yes gene_type:complete